MNRDSGGKEKRYPPLENSSEPVHCSGIGILPISLKKLITENKKLQQTVEQLHNSLSEAISLIGIKERETTSLQRRCKKLEHFRKYREHEFLQWEENWKCFKKISKEEKELTEVVEELKKKASKAGRDVHRKDEEVRKLKGIVAKLQDGEKFRSNVLKMSQCPKETECGGKAGVLIFPEEIWDLIFRNLSNQEDLWNCRNTCQMFDVILCQWKATWLFEKALPNLFKFLPKNKLLECRLVSKGWNRAVDHFLENHPSIRPHGEYKYDARIMPFVNPMKEKQLNMVNHFEFSGENLICGNPGLIPRRHMNQSPFIGRSVTLNIWMNLNSMDNDNAISHSLWARIYSFLATSGKHIWYLTINTSNGNRDLADRDKQKMIQFLTVDLSILVPNLRRLRIQPGFCEDFSNMNQAMCIRNLPRMTKLETIEADHSNVKEDNPIFIALLKKHQIQLRALHLKVKTWKAVCELGLDWPNLWELQLDQLAVKEDFVSLAHAKLPKLKKLGVRLCGNNGQNFDLFLEVIHRLCATTSLTTLRLYEGVGSSIFKGMRSDLCMPSALTTLEVEHCGEYSFYTFLLRFPLLENLHVFWRKTPAHLWFSWESRGEIELLPESEYYRSEWREDRLPFEEEAYRLQGAEELEVDLNRYMYQGKIYQSNIWEVLPRLKVFTFQWDVYTRAGYEQFISVRKKNYLSTNKG